MRFPGGKFVWLLCSGGTLLACLLFLPATQQAQQGQPAQVAQPAPPPAPPPPMVGPPARIAAQAIFNSRCATCHQNVMASANANALGPKSAPTTETLGQMTPEAIYAALTTGAMVGQARDLSDAQKRIIAEFFGGRPLGDADAGDAKNMSGHCDANPPIGDPSAQPGWNGWGNGLSNLRFQPAAAARLSADQLPSLKLKWAFGIPDGAETYGQPAIVSGRVFFGDYNGFVYSLNASTGCVYWSFHADAQVRTAIVVGPVKGRADARYAAYFGDKKANVYAVDARTGKLLWRVNPEPRLLEHVTGGAALYEGRVFVGVAGSEEITSLDPHYPCCTYRGSLSAIDANTGKIIWKTYTIAEAAKPTKKNSLGTQLWGPAGASIWTTPTIDPQRHAVYVGTGNAFSGAATKTSDAIVAFDIQTGKILWSYQALANDVSPAGCNGPGPKGEQCPPDPGPDWDFGNSPILETLPDGKRVLVAADKGGLVAAVDPDNNGALLWKTDLAEPNGGTAIQIMWGGAADGDNVYYSLKAGGVAAVRLADGQRAWTTRIDPAVIPSEAGKRLRRGLEAAVTAIPGVVFAGGWDGVLHALSTEDGHPLWQYETVRDYTTVNGVPAKGGSLGAPGPVVAAGMLYVGSGYVGTGNGIPGNVLLAFSAQ